MSDHLARNQRLVHQMPQGQKSTTPRTRCPDDVPKSQSPHNADPTSDEWKTPQIPQVHAEGEVVQCALGGMQGQESQEGEKVQDATWAGRMIWNRLNLVFLLRLCFNHFEFFRNCEKLIFCYFGKFEFIA